ncbi:MAG: hypothetical protein NZM43_11255 [Saprospiraceae bacterium]|nr:hypothetical protein [Saprospiraceae bacterium]MDW8484885.1 hypothetical protein [Saprospiraceae bacterium]
MSRVFSSTGQLDQFILLRTSARKLATGENPSCIDCREVQQEFSSVSFRILRNSQ